MEALVNKFIAFNEIHKQMFATDSSKDILIDVTQCIRDRIQFKYGCVKKQDRNENHEQEVARHVFHKQKYLELKQVYTLLLDKLATMEEEVKKRVRSNNDHEEDDDKGFISVRSKRRIITSRPKYK